MLARIYSALSGTDPEDVIKNAFSCFDEQGTGKIHKDDLCEILTTMGERMKDSEVYCRAITLASYS